MRRSSRRWIKALTPSRLTVAEISGKWGESFSFRSYEIFRYPEYDICAGPFLDEAGQPRKFDLILADQVWEHLDRPYSAIRNVLKMLRKGGHFYIATPFFIPYHGAPIDCSRWSARGMTNLLIEGGFAPDAIRAEQWGNRAAALRNLETPWPPEYRDGEDDLENDPLFPMVTWALAQKT
ncbi:class I SAM-dependent methyltransferase [Pseudooceanicola sp. C21-150M6]|uniref:class I SAM-dependent methyltransferase n=1 Tax=Pseudooceanicola sp. C21-150M6 TaxID=3434355 RepID=UPI003D7F44BD